MILSAATFLFKLNYPFANDRIPQVAIAISPLTTAMMYRLICCLPDRLDTIAGKHWFAPMGGSCSPLTSTPANASILQTAAVQTFAI